MWGYPYHLNSIDFDGLRCIRGLRRLSETIIFEFGYLENHLGDHASPRTLEGELEYAFSFLWGNCYSLVIYRLHFYLLCDAEFDPQMTGGVVPSEVAVKAAFRHCREGRSRVRFPQKSEKILGLNVDDDCGI